MKKSKVINRLLVVSCLSGVLISVPALADRCDPKMLSKLPDKKRMVMEKNCKKRAKAKKFTISNKCCVDKEVRPEDNYDGSDKDKFDKMIRKSWKKKYPKDNILGVHFHATDWKRTKNKRWNGAISAWQYTDVSVLPVRVVVKTDSKVATIFPAYINKDNDDGSINTGVATKGSQYVIKQMLVENY